MLAKHIPAIRGVARSPHLLDKKTWLRKAMIRMNSSTLTNPTNVVPLTSLKGSMGVQHYSSYKGLNDPPVQPLRPGPLPLAPQHGAYQPRPRRVSDRQQPAGERTSSSRSTKPFQHLLKGGEAHSAEYAQQDTRDFETVQPRKVERERDDELHGLLEQANPEQSELAQNLQQTVLEYSGEHRYPRPAPPNTYRQRC